MSITSVRPSLSERIWLHPSCNTLIRLAKESRSISPQNEEYRLDITERSQHSTYLSHFAHNYASSDYVECTQRSLALTFSAYPLQRNNGFLFLIPCC